MRAPPISAPIFWAARGCASTTTSPTCRRAARLATRRCPIRSRGAGSTRRSSRSSPRSSRTSPPGAFRARPSDWFEMVDNRRAGCSVPAATVPDLLMPSKAPLEAVSAIATHDRATPSLVYRSLLKSLHNGHMVPGAKLPNERDLARRLNTSRTAVRAALAMMERQGLIRRRVGSGTFLTDDADQVFGRMDQTNVSNHGSVPSFVEIVEGRLLFEPAMMHLVVTRVEDREIA